MKHNVLIPRLIAGDNFFSTIQGFLEQLQSGKQIDVNSMLKRKCIVSFLHQALVHLNMSV